MPMPRKPLSEHALAGTRVGYVELESFVPSGRPKCPRAISGEAKAAFKRLTRMLENRRSVTPGDQEILRLYAVLFDRHSRALAAIEKQGEICMYTRLNNRGEDVQVEKPNLWLKVAETCEAKMLSCLSALGLTPLNRSKVKTVDVPRPPEPEAFPTLAEMKAQAADADDIDLSKIDLEGIQ